MEIIYEYLAQEPINITEVENNPALENKYKQSDGRFGNRTIDRKDKDGKDFYLTLCGGVFPTYMRIEQKTEYGPGRYCGSIANLINESSQVLKDSQRERQNLYEKLCPKCLYGLYAVLAYFSIYDDITESLNIEIDGNRIKESDLYDVYYKYVYNFIYRSYQPDNKHTYKERYEAFLFRGKTDETNIEKKKCREAVLAFENTCIQKSEESIHDIDNRFFNGLLKDTVENYIIYCQNKVEDKKDTENQNSASQNDCVEQIYKDEISEIKEECRTRGRKKDLTIDFLGKNEEEKSENKKNVENLALIISNKYENPKGKIANALYNVLTDCVEVIPKLSSKRAFLNMLKDITKKDWGNQIKNLYNNEDVMKEIINDWQNIQMEIEQKKVEI